jgi:hypothetical protein
MLAELIPRVSLVALEGGGHPATGTIHRAGRFNAVRSVATGEVSDAAWLSEVHRDASAPLHA